MLVWELVVGVSLVVSTCTAAVTYLGVRSRHGALPKARDAHLTPEDPADTAYRQLAANLPHTSVFVVDRELRYVLAEGSGLQSGGYDVAAMTGRYAGDVVPLGTWEQLEPHYRAAVEGRTTELDLRFPHGDVYHVRAVPVRDPAGAVTGGLVVVEDVSEQREALARRDEALAFSEAALAASPDLTLIVDLSSGRTSWTSRELDTLLAFPAQRAGRPLPDLLDLVVPEDLDAVRRADHDLRSKADGETVGSRFRVIGPHGTQRWLSRRATPFDRGEDGLPRQALCVVRDVTDVVDAEERLRHAAVHDPLTGLPNRTLLPELIGAAQARHPGAPDESGEVVLLFCDIDGFKNVNDTYGHVAGDAVLVEVAHRLRNTLRQGDAVARVGGDEFVVVLEPSARTGEDTAVPAEMLAERIRAAVDIPVPYAETELRVSMSVGLARVQPSHTPEETLRDADAAMYRAKQRGKNRVELFDDSLLTDGRERRSIESAVRAALAPHVTGTAALRTVYQPVYALTDQTLVGFEALARLTDLDGRPVPPDQFIRIAEDTGLIDRLGALVLERALGDLVEWRRQHPAGAGVTMSVNLSARQVQHTDLAAQIANALERHDLRPADLVLELTESVLLDSVSSVLDQLTALHDSGVQIAIDDFGTGYASLRYLATFPVDIVKVDRSFTGGLPHDPTSAAIVRTVAALAEQLELHCVVEGIETEEQLVALPPGVLGQGFLLGHPAETMTWPGSGGRGAAGSTGTATRGQPSTT